MVVNRSLLTRSILTASLVPLVVNAGGSASPSTGQSANGRIAFAYDTQLIITSPVLIDVSPPQSEGPELARSLSAHHELPAIVLMSATPSDAILSNSAGAELFLPKAGMTADAIAKAAKKPRS